MTWDVKQQNQQQLSLQAVIDPDQYRARVGPGLPFDTLIVFPNDFFEKVKFGKNVRRRQQKHEKILIMQTVKSKFRLQQTTVIREMLGLILLDFSLTVKAVTLILISGCGSAISSAKEGKSGFMYNLLKS